jgi:hypothetical protein
MLTSKTCKTDERKPLPLLYIMKRGMVDAKKFIAISHCKCNIGVVKMLARILQDSGSVSCSGSETNQSNGCKL